MPKTQEQLEQELDELKERVKKLEERVEELKAKREEDKQYKRFTCAFAYDEGEFGCLRNHFGKAYLIRANAPLSRLRVGGWYEFCQNCSQSINPYNE